MSIAQDRNFVPVATVNGELYLLDLNSIESGDNNEIKYIQLISFKKKQTHPNGEKYLSVQMYMKGKCNVMINKPYVLQYYDAQMKKGNIVRTAKWGGDWSKPKKGTAYHVVLEEACKN